jgi:hypothetical protein
MKLNTTKEVLRKQLRRYSSPKKVKALRKALAHHGEKPRVRIVEVLKNNVPEKKKGLLERLAAYFGWGK